MTCSARWGRKRKEHTRSRNGCSVCRKRHLRCDEARPSCNRCVRGGWTCHYDPQGVSRRIPSDRLPGELEPWLLMSSSPGQQPGVAGDPFGCFPIEMPLKSRQILHYFLEMYRDLPVDPIDCISLSYREPIRFRSLLLIAASYYAWNAGGLHDLQSTYLYHMAKCIRQVNDWLEKQGDSFRQKQCVIELMACLSITESLVGNFSASKVHLDGLITMLEIQRSQARKNRHLSRKKDAEYADFEEMAERHTMISFDFTTGLKTHRREVNSGVFSIKGHRVQPKEEAWKKDFMGHDERINAMKRILRFFSLPDLEAKTRRIDARSSIEAVRRTTKLVDQGTSSRYYHTPLPGPAWTFGSSALMMVSEGEPFLETSDRVTSRMETPLLTSRSCLDVACGFYMYGVLGVGNGDGAVESRFTRQVFETLKRDVDESEKDMTMGSINRNFWLWKVVIGAHGLALMELQSKVMSNDRLFDTIAGGESTIQGLKAWFRERFRLWSKITGVTEYEGVREALATIAWPEKRFAREAVTEKVWKDAMLVRTDARRSATQVESS